MRNTVIQQQSDGGFNTLLVGLSGPVRQQYGLQYVSTGPQQSCTTVVVRYMFTVTTDPQSALTDTISSVVIVYTQHGRGLNPFLLGFVHRSGFPIIDARAGGGRVGFTLSLRDRISANQHFHGAR